MLLSRCGIGTNYITSKALILKSTYSNIQTAEGDMSANFQREMMSHRHSVRTCYLSDIRKRDMVAPSATFIVIGTHKTKIHLTTNMSRRIRKCALFLFSFLGNVLVQILCRNKIELHLKTQKEFITLSSNVYHRSYECSNLYRLSWKL